MKNFAPLIHDFLTLKKIRRTGWQLRGIRDAESLADHCFGVVFLTYLLADQVEQKIDRDHAVALAIIHEVGECRVGDIPFTALKYFPNKSEIEIEAVQDILAPLGPEAVEKHSKLFIEFEECKTIESRFVKAIDKLEMLITAAEYEKTGYSSLTDFWENETTFRAFQEFKSIYEFAQNLRDERIKRLNGQNDYN